MSLHIIKYSLVVLFVLFVLLWSNTDRLVMEPCLVSTKTNHFGALFYLKENDLYLKRNSYNLPSHPKIYYC